MFSTSSLARDFSLDRATSSSLIGNSTIGRSSITVRLSRHPGITFSIRTPLFLARECSEDASLQFKLAVQLRDDALADQLHALHDFAVFETAELNPGQHLVHAHLAISAEQL